MPSNRIGKFISTALPRLGLSTMFVCFFSGIILCFYYRPFANVFQNIEEITTLVPFGWFFRQLHFASGQAFVILMLLHGLEHFSKKRYRNYPPKAWIYLVLGLCLCFYGLFTGFILKGDKEGIFAAQILMNILKGLPFLGNMLYKLFILPGNDLFFIPYIYHCFFIPTLIILLIKDHIVRWIPEPNLFFASLLGLFLYSLLVRPQIDIPPDAIVKSISGPWFFLGIQTLLRFFPETLAGIIFPALFWGCVVIQPMLEKNRKLPQNGKSIHTLFPKIVYYGILSVGIGYALLSVKTAIWGH